MIVENHSDKKTLFWIGLFIFQSLLCKFPSFYFFPPNLRKLIPSSVASMDLHDCKEWRVILAKFRFRFKPPTYSPVNLILQRKHQRLNWPISSSFAWRKTNVQIIKTIFLLRWRPSTHVQIANGSSPKNKLTLQSRVVLAILWQDLGDNRHELCRGVILTASSYCPITLTCMKTKTQCTTIFIKITWLGLHLLPPFATASMQGNKNLKTLWY